MDGGNTQKLDATLTAMDALQSGYDEFMSSGLEDKDAARVATIAKARDLIATLETPLESIIWMAWAEVCILPSKAIILYS